MSEINSVEEQQAQLLRRIAGQDRAALSEFYDQTARIIFSFALRMLGDTHDAEEVVQDVFVQIWNKAQTFDPVIGVPFHWAMGITRNRCIDRLRARHRRSRVLVEMEEGVEAEPAIESADEPALSGNELEAVRSAVITLPKDQRQAIEMAFFGGLTHQEIAEALHEPLGTVKARIRRGMLKLRESLEAYV
jgi:RNA polymerase sigma-70 factor (ECF subfamily)